MKIENFFVKITKNDAKHHCFNKKVGKSRKKIVFLKKSLAFLKIL